MKVPKSKRATDLVLGAAALVLSAPAWLLGAALVRATMGSPVFFRQRRPGHEGRQFEVLKFRTMRPPDPARPLADEGRLTPVGRFLRATSVDELPQLVNVLRGEMSLVGPRPFLAEYLDRYRPEHRRRFDLPPGMTGWAVVNGRQSLPFSKRLDLDAWYVDHWSWWLDVEIMARTAWMVLTMKGQNSDQHVSEVDDLGLNPESESPRVNPP